MFYFDNTKFSVIDCIISQQVSMKYKSNMVI